MHVRLAAALLLTAAPALAQQTDTLRTPTRPEGQDVAARELVVTARRGLDAATRATATVTAVPLGGAASVADALARQTTAFVRPLGLTGLATLALRGTGPAQTAVLLDGLRLTDPMLGHVDLRLLPAALLGAATLVSGSGSAFHGSDAVGGTLHLDARDDRRAGGAVEAGAFGTVRADAHGGVRSGQTTVTAVASAEAVRGDFPYPDPVYQTTARRDGADSRLAALVVRAATPRPAAAYTSLGLWLAAADRGLAPSAGTPATDERQTDGLARVWTVHERPLGRATLRLAGVAHAGRIRYVHPGLGLDETARTQVLGIEAEASRPFGLRAEGGIGAEATTARATHPQLDGGAREHALAAFAHGSFARGRLLVAPALRADVYLRDAGTRSSGPLAAASPRLGLRLGLGGGLAVRASAATAFRAPTLNDRFWAGAGRPDLRPERARLADAALVLDRATDAAAWHAEATAFAHAVRDQIVWTPDASGRWRPENVQRTATRGLDLSARWSAPGGPARPSMSAAASFTDARDRSDPASAAYGRQLRYVPRLVARAGVAASPGRLDLSLDARYVGTRFATADESQALAPVVTLDAGAGVRIGRFRLGVRLDNLLSTHAPLLDGYPMPGRAAYVRLSFD